jgi:hypothetical protein
VVLEAMASGLPVIAYDYACAQQHVRQQTGWLCQLGDTAAFIQCIHQLPDRQALKRMGLKAREIFRILAGNIQFSNSNRRCIQRQRRSCNDLSQAKALEERTVKLKNAKIRMLDLDLKGCIYLNTFSRSERVAQFFKIISRLGDGMFWYVMLAAVWILQGLMYGS